MNKRALVALQLAFNQVLFGGKLKKIPVSVQKIPEKYEAIGLFYYNTRTKKPSKIVIEKRQPDESQIAVLVHEMVHQWELTSGKSKKGGKQHPESFKKKLRELHKKLGWRPPPAWSLRG